VVLGAFGDESKGVYGWTTSIGPRSFN
jgi:hypothetical protein